MYNTEYFKKGKRKYSEIILIQENELYSRDTEIKLIGAKWEISYFFISFIFILFIFLIRIRFFNTTQKSRFLLRFHPGKAL